MRDSKDFYVKNKLDKKGIYYRLTPVMFPEDDFSYKATKLVTGTSVAERQEFNLTYKDIHQMYEDGFYTIEQHEFERVEALVSMQAAELKE